MFTGCLSPKAHHFKGRDQCEIPQFKAGEKEAIAQKRYVESLFMVVRHSNDHRTC